MTPSYLRVLCRVVHNERAIILQRLAYYKRVRSQSAYQLNHIRRPSERPGRPSAHVRQSIMIGQVPRREVMRYSDLYVDLPSTRLHISVGRKGVIHPINLD